MYVKFKDTNEDYGCYDINEDQAELLRVLIDQGLLDDDIEVIWNEEPATKLY